MLSVKRQQDILEYIAARQSVQVTELSEVFEASLATVRRDLSLLEEQGVIRRVHGGALFVGQQAEPPVMQRKTQQAEHKKRIGRAAAELVTANDTIIITSGTTTETMVPYLAEKANLTVITNAINVAHLLVRYPDINVIVLGGYLRHSEFSLLGHFTDQMLKDVHASKVFHGVFGISEEYGLTGSYFEEAQTDRAVFAAADELIILADHTKFNQSGPIRLAPLEAVSTLITDSEAPAGIIRAVRDRGLKVIQA